MHLFSHFPNEIIDLIFEFLPVKFSISLGRSVVKRRVLARTSMPDLWEIADEECLRWLHKNKVPGGNFSTWISIARVYNMDLIQWLDHAMSNVLKRVWLDATRERRGDVIAWLDAKFGKFHFQGDVITSACVMGQLHTVKYMYSLGFSATDEDFHKAVNGGYVDLVDFLCDQNRSHRVAFRTAVLNGNLALAKNLKRRGFECVTNLIPDAYLRGLFDMVQCLISEGYTCDTRALHYAVIVNNFKLVKLLHVNGSAVDEGALNRASDYWIIKYLKRVLERQRK